MSVLEALAGLASHGRHNPAGEVRKFLYHSPGPRPPSSGAYAIACQEDRLAGGGG